MIVQMIIHIGDQNKKGHSSPKLLDVRLSISAVDAQGIDNFRVKVFARVGRISTHERGG